MTLELLLRWAGATMLGLSALHVGFPQRFRWKTELAGLSLLNRQLMGVHTFFVALTVALMGALGLCCAGLLLTPSPLARVLDAGLAVFWLARLWVQLFVYDPSLWRGRPRRQAVHLAFVGLFSGYAALYACALWRQS